MMLSPLLLVAMSSMMMASNVLGKPSIRTDSSGNIIMTTDSGAAISMNGFDTVAMFTVLQDTINALVSNSTQLQSDFNALTLEVQALRANASTSQSIIANLSSQNQLLAAQNQALNYSVLNLTILYAQQQSMISSLMQSQSNLSASNQALNTTVTTVLGSISNITTEYNLIQRSISNITLQSQQIASNVTQIQSSIINITNEEAQLSNRLTVPSFISSFVGTGIAAYSGDGGFAPAAELQTPIDTIFDSTGSMLLTDQWNSRIRKVDASTGIITTIAGTSTAGYNGDGIPATSAQVNNPSRLAFDAHGNLIFADYENNRIRMINESTGIISTIVGTGVAGFNGDDISAKSAQINGPYDVILDSSGNLIIADTFNSRVRRVNASNGIITTIAGTGVTGFNGDHMNATSSQLNNPC